MRLVIRMHKDQPKRGKTDRRAEALRRNLQRRKAQARGRAQAGAPEKDGKRDV